MDILLPIIGVAVLQPAGIEAEERIMAEKERPAVVGAEGKFDPIEFTPAPEVPPFGPSPVIDAGFDAVARRRGCEHIGNQALVPAPDLKIHAPAIIGAPMPV